MRTRTSLVDRRADEGPAGTPYSVIFLYCKEMYCITSSWWWWWVVVSGSQWWSGSMVSGQTRKVSLDDRSRAPSCTKYGYGVQCTPYSIQEVWSEDLLRFARLARTLASEA